MSLPIARLLAAALLLAAASCASAECRLGLVSRLPLTPSHGALLVPVTLDGKPAQLIFDTGAQTTLLAMTAVDRIGIANMRAEEVQSALLFAPMGQVRGIGGARTAGTVTARTVDIGGLKAKNFNFLAADMAFPFADGLLSIDLISQYDVDLDFPENQILLYRPNDDCRSPAAFLASPLYTVPLLPNGDDRRPRVMVTVGGKQLVGLVDTGASHTAIFRQAAERLGLDLSTLGDDRRELAAGIGPHSVGAVRHAFEPVSIGDLIFDNMKVDILDAHGEVGGDMLLGADFQHAVHLWISYSSRTLIMQFPPRPSKKLE